MKSENEIPPLVSSIIEILLRTSLSLILVSIDSIYLTYNNRCHKLDRTYIWRWCPPCKSHVWQSDWSSFIHHTWPLLGETVHIFGNRWYSFKTAHQGRIVPVVPRGATCLQHERVEVRWCNDFNWKINIFSKLIQQFLYSIYLIN